MANQYNGEIKIELYDKIYPMKINMRVIAEFQSETGKDFMHCAIRAMNAMAKCAGMSPLEQAEVMTEAVSLSDAAHLFYLAAKECDKVPEFDEFQEAVLFEGPLITQRDGKLTQSYPFIFANLVMFAIFGAFDEEKKQ